MTGSGSANTSELAQWMASRQLAIQHSFSYMSYHYTTADDAMVAVDTLVGSAPAAAPHQWHGSVFTCWPPRLVLGPRSGPGSAGERRHDGWHLAAPFPYSVPRPDRGRRATVRPVVAVYRFRN